MSDERTLWVTGMCCGDCREQVAAALRAVPGVTHVLVDLSRNEAVVRGTTARRDLVAAVEAAGFGISPYPDPEPRGVG